MLVRLKQWRIAAINKVKTSSLYWRYRHIFDFKTWERYALDAMSDRRKFYVRFIRNNQINSVFEFGCASGSNILALEHHLPPSYQLYFFGYDISSAAIGLALKKEYSKTVHFSTKLNIKEIELFFKKNSLLQFDLAIFDRVLYLLKVESILEHFTKYGRYYNFVIIDDFVGIEPPEKPILENYAVRNYIKLMSDLNFVLIESDKTEHEIGDSRFLKDFAKRLCFKRIGS